MALEFFDGFESGDFGHWDSTTGTLSVQGTVKKTGDFAMYVNAASGYAKKYLTAAEQTAGSVSFYFRVDTCPDSDNDLIRPYLSYDGAASYKGKHLQITSTGYLKFAGGNTGATQLSLETFHRIDIEVYRDGGTLKANLWINGSPELLAQTPITEGGVATPEFGLGAIGDQNGVYYFDDVVFDYSQAGDLGDIRVLRSSPNAAGAHAEFDTISGYTYCDEVPADGATTIVDDSGVSSIHRETYNLQDYATIGVGASDTWKAVNVWVQAYDSGNTAQGITVRDDGTDYETMLQFGKAYTWKNKLYDTNAPRASAWTKEIFDAFQAGGYNEGSKDVYMSCVMVMVAYTPAEDENVVVTPPTLSLTLTEYIPILKEVTTPTTLSLSVTEYIPPIIIGTIVTPTTLNIATTAYIPTLKEVVTPTTLSLAITKYIPILKEVLTPSKLSLTTTTYIPPLIFGTILTPSTLSLSLTEYISTITISENVTVTPTTLSLTITEYIPILKETLTPTTINLTLTKYAPILKETLTPTTLSLTTTAYVPVLKEVVTPSKLSLTVTGYVPILKEVTTPSTVSLSITGYIPILKELITPSTLSLSTTTYIPTLKETLTPEVVNLILAGYIPTVTVVSLGYKHSWGIIFG